MESGGGGRASRRRSRALLHYGLSIAAVSGATGLSIALWNLTQPTPSLMYFPAIMVVALYCGLGPALLATVLSFAAVTFFLLPPYYSFKAAPIDVVRLAVFAFTTVVVSWLAAARQRAESALLDLTRSLEGQVADRTAEVERTHRVMEASRRLEAIGHLAGGVAHDFSNLLTIVIGNTELLVDRVPRNAPLRPMIDEIQTAAYRGAKLTRQLLAYARRQPLHVENVCLNDVIAQTVPRLAQLAPDTVRVETRLDGGGADVLGDRAQLEQVLLNLCVNATDAMPSGGVLTLETTSIDCAGSRQADQHNLQPGSYVRLEVRDTGTGMNAETLRHAVEPFFTTKPVGQGTGLGLSTAYGIVRQLKGDLVLRSAEGAGTQVILYLPVAPRRLADERV